mmetsp:Transcript_40748/g.105422  ORF Transcript_40748/g.105422 Transcript_40748/m.105422 type:complete len:214 (-) Transcript_40748:278-919(-)
MHSMAKWETKLASRKGIMRSSQDCQSQNESMMLTCSWERPLASTCCSGMILRKTKKPTGMNPAMYAKSTSTDIPMAIRVMPIMLTMPKAMGKPMMAHDFVCGPRGVITLTKVGSKTPSASPIMKYEMKTSPTHFRSNRKMQSGIKQPTNMTAMARYTRSLGEKHARRAFCPRVMTILPYCTLVTAVVKTCPTWPVSPMESFTFRSCCRGPIKV